MPHHFRHTRRWPAEDSRSLTARLADATAPPAAAAEAVARLGIVPRDDETPGEALLRVMAEENGLPVMAPSDNRLAEAIVCDEGATKFLWGLA